MYGLRKCDETIHAASPQTINDVRPPASHACHMLIIIVIKTNARKRGWQENGSEDFVVLGQPHARSSQVIPRYAYRRAPGWRPGYTRRSLWLPHHRDKWSRST